jgi:cytidine deaminase
MSEDWRDLFEAARAVRERAYAPYSKFLVGAAVRAPSGRVYAGCNVENAAYPAGNCAEAGAISAMVAAGERRIVAVLVIGAGEALVTPCGICRQQLREFGTPDTPVHIADATGVRKTFTLGELLPSSFGPDNLRLAAPA